MLIADDSGTDMGDQQKAKLRIETRWKLIKAENPAMGDKSSVDVTSGGNEIQAPQVLLYVPDNGRSLNVENTE